MSQPQSKVPAVPPQTPADVSLFEENGAYILRSSTGLSLYRYDLDVDGKSHCVDACSLKWPPLLASAGATPVVGEWRTQPRGAAHQWTYRGRPIYTFADDAPGTTRGDGVGGAWHLVTP